MAFVNIYLTEMGQLFYSPAIAEVTKAVLVSVGWIGGLTAFVYWKDKHNKIAGTR